MLSSNDFNAKQIIFLVTKNHEKLSFRNDNVIITDEDDKIIHQSTCYRLFAIFIIGHFTITSGLIQRSNKFGFSIVMMSNSFRMYSCISNLAEGNVLLKRKQYEYTDIGAAKQLIINKINNQRQLLIELRSKTEYDIEAIDLLSTYAIKVSNSNEIASIMAMEGNASKIYFRRYFDNIKWIGRKPRIKYDMVNALLDIGYTILFCYIDSIAAVFGFDRYVGILHRQFYMRKSLVCDLVEPFRVVIDKQIKKSINLGQFKDDDFMIDNGRWLLNYKCSSKYSGIFFKAILEYKDDIYIYIRDFYRSIMKGTLSDKMPEWFID